MKHCKGVELDDLDLEEVCGGGASAGPMIKGISCGAACAGCAACQAQRLPPSARAPRRAGSRSIKGGRFRR